MGATIPIPSLRRMTAYASLARAYGLRAFCRKAANAMLSRPMKRLLLNSYSESFEDIVVDALLGGKESGFYVDIGANHPLRGNNTMYFYRKGWRGINIEPDMACCKEFAEKRPRDITLNIGVSLHAGKGTFFSFLPSTRSTLSEECAERMVKKGFQLVGKREIELRPLADILQEYDPGGMIDFMSVDTEGHDKQVLLSNDWARFRPSVICVETGDEGIESFLSRHGYWKVASTKDNSIFKLKEQSG